MSKDFFSIIGDQLCKIKNSPFSKLSDLNNPSMVHSNLKESKTLAYDPDRLFNPDKSKLFHQEDPLYEEFQRDEKEELERIEITLLKETTQEQINKIKEKGKYLKGHDFVHPFSIFQANRSACLCCTKCFEYSGNFNTGVSVKVPELQKPVEYLCCLECGCPMNSHVTLEKPNPYMHEIFRHLSSAELYETKHLNYTYYPICFKKEAEKSANATLRNFYNYLPQLGFNIISRATLSKKQFQLFQMKCEVLTGMEKQTVEKLLNIIDSAEGESESWNWDEYFLANAESENAKEYTILKKILNKANTLHPLKDDQEIVVFFSKSNQNQLSHFQMIDLLKHYEPMLGCNFLWIPQKQKEKFIASTLLFPEFFALSHQIFILPSQKTKAQSEKVFARFKDILDFNSYSVIGGIKNIKRAKLQEVLKWENPNKVNYILGEQMLNETISRVKICLTAKVGPPMFTIPFKNAVDFIEISSAEQKSPFMTAFPDYLGSQRCALLLRPIFSQSKLEQILMSLLRINGFILLKRRPVVLTEKEAYYLATVQNIPKDSLEAYIQMMTSGACEIVLVSKRGAIYEANILANGSKEDLCPTKTKTLKSLPMIEIRRGTQTYEYTPHIESVDENRNGCFNSLGEIFKLDSVVFPQLSQKQCRYVTHSKTGKLLKIEEDSEEGKKGIKVSSKQKEQMLKEIRADNFNYWLFASKSESITEEVAGMFMPECTLFESCLLIVKPTYIHLVERIRQALSEHRYHVIMEKTVQLSKILATELIMGLKKINYPNSVFKKIIEAYSNEKIHIFCVSKIFARHEMFSMLSQFTFVPSKSIVVDEYIDDEKLKEVLVPAWRNEELLLKVLSAPLYNPEEAINELFSPGLNKVDKFDILTYFVGSYYGVNISDLSLNSRLGKFSYYISSPVLANLQSWYYSSMSASCAKYVPLLFQHREIGGTCFVIQSDCGLPFLNLISNQYQEEKAKMKLNQEEFVENSSKSERKSLVLFLWAKLLAEFVDKITAQKSPMKGWGLIQKKNEEWQGESSNQSRLDEEKHFLHQCKRKFQEENELEISNLLEKVSASRFLSEKYNANTGKRVLLPSFEKSSLDECIRIIQIQEVSKLHLMDKYSKIDPFQERQNLKDLYTLNLYNVEPSIGTRQELTVEIMVFLLKWSNDSVEYSEMFTKLLEYFNQNVLAVMGASYIDMLEAELYLRLIKEFLKTGQRWLKDAIRKYPNLRKSASALKEIDNDQGISGKKRKFLEKKQYYVDQQSHITEQQRQTNNKKYTEFNLNYERIEAIEKELEQQLLKSHEAKQSDSKKQNPLHNMNDPVQRQFATQSKYISLLREGDQKPRSSGINVEYEKRITESEEILMSKIKGEVDKFHLEKQQAILHEGGLQTELWYRKVRGEKQQSKQSKVSDAINTQIGKFINFKKEQEQEAKKKFGETM